MKALLLVVSLFVGTVTGMCQDMIRDVSFNNNRYTANANVRCIAVQADQKIIFFGNCSFYDGVYQPYGGRLLKTGLLDPSFSPITLDARVDDAVIQPWDQKIVIGGSFTKVNGVSRSGIARLNTDGSLDLTFNPGQGIASGYGDLRVWCLAIKDAPDPLKRRIMVGGQFEQFDGAFIGTRGGLVQLFENGSRDVAYAPLVEKGPVYAMYLDKNNKLLIGGEFWSAGGAFKLRIARLNEDGTLDNSFSSGAGFSGPNSSVTTIAVMPDDKVVIGGYFTQFNGITRRGLARLNSDGSLDPAFNNGLGFQGGGSIYDNATEVRRVFSPGDGTIIAGGNFTTYNGTAYQNIVKLMSDGSVDPGMTFGTGFNEWVIDIQEQEYLPSDKRILVGGFFDTYRGYTQGAIMRLFTSAVLKRSAVYAEASAAGDEVFIKFTENSGNNNATVFVRRSSDGVHFESIHQGSLSSFSKNGDQYVWKDKQPLPGNSWYQVMVSDQPDIAVSNIVTVKYDGNAQLSLSVFPNPFVDKVQVKSLLPEAIDCYVHLYDIKGGLLKKWKWVMPKGAGVNSFAVPATANGKVILMITGDAQNVLLSTTLVRKD